MLELQASLALQAFKAPPASWEPLARLASWETRALQALLVQRALQAKAEPWE